MGIPMQLEEAILQLVQLVELNSWNPVVGWR